MIVENYIGEKELDQCKSGFTWKYVIEEKRTEVGRLTVITCETIHKTPSGFTFGTPYPFDSGGGRIRRSMRSARRCSTSAPSPAR